MCNMVVGVDIKHTRIVCKRKIQRIKLVNITFFTMLSGYIDILHFAKSKIF